MEKNERGRSAGKIRGLREKIKIWEKVSKMSHSTPLRMLNGIALTIDRSWNF